MDPGHDPWIYKALGSLLGSIAGLIYMKPKNRQDAIARFFVSFAAGMTYYFVPAEYFAWPLNNERTFAGAALVAFAAWPLAGLLFRWMTKKVED